MLISITKFSWVTWPSHQFPNLYMFSNSDLPYNAASSSFQTCRYRKVIQIVCYLYVTSLHGTYNTNEIYILKMSQQLRFSLNPGKYAGIRWFKDASKQCQKKNPKCSFLWRYTNMFSKQNTFCFKFNPKKALLREALPEGSLTGLLFSFNLKRV